MYLNSIWKTKRNPEPKKEKKVSIFPKQLTNMSLYSSAQNGGRQCSLLMESELLIIYIMLQMTGVCV